MSRLTAAARKKVLDWLDVDRGRAEQPIASISLSARELGPAIDQYLKVAVDAHVQEIATHLVEEYFYSTESGQHLVRQIKASIDHYPSIQDHDIRTAVADAIVKVFVE